MNFLRGWWRLLKMAWITGLQILKIWMLEMFSGPDKKRRDRLKVAWAIRICKALGIEILKRGEFPQTKVCYAPNHRSYIDVVLMVAQAPVSYLGKAEVKKWPLIGTGAKLVDTIWVNRDNKESRQKSRDEIAEKMKLGTLICVHPEGTTRRAPEMAEFRPGIFVMAARAGIPVIPVAIEYENADDAWVGEDTFVPHFLKTFGRKKIRVHLSAGPPVSGEDPKQMMEETRDWIEGELVRLGEKGDLLMSRTKFPTKT